MTKVPKPKAAAKAATPAQASPKGAKVEKPKAGNKPNALQQPLQPSTDLAAVVGKGTMARGEVVSKVWVYIKANKLQDAAKKTMINADAKLKEIFKKAQVSMFEMTKLINGHLS